MLKVVYTSTFRKIIRRRLTTPSQRRKFQDHLKLFLKDTSSPILKDHKLTGDLANKRAFIPMLKQNDVF